MAESNDKILAQLRWAQEILKGVDESKLPAMDELRAPLGRMIKDVANRTGLDIGQVMTAIAAKETIRAHTEALEQNEEDVWERFSEKVAKMMAKGVLAMCRLVAESSGSV